MNLTISILLITVGLINFLPVIGIISAEKLSAAYAVELIGNDIVIFDAPPSITIRTDRWVYALFRMETFLSIRSYGDGGYFYVGFLFFVAAADHYNASITKIAIIDLIGLAGLAIAAGLKYLSRNSFF